LLAVNHEERFSILKARGSYDKSDQTYYIHNPNFRSRQNEQEIRVSLFFIFADEIQEKDNPAADIAT
jgi:hypothetical protein